MSLAPLYLWHLWSFCMGISALTSFDLPDYRDICALTPLFHPNICKFAWLIYKYIHLHNVNCYIWLQGFAGRKLYTLNIHCWWKLIFHDFVTYALLPLSHSLQNLFYYSPNTTPSLELFDNIWQDICTP